MKQVVVIGTVLLVIISCLPALTATNEKGVPLLLRGSRVYVGGSGPGNYSTIQAAIDNATDGDTVFVYDDSSPYHERIKVTKSLVIVGERQETTVIDANGVSPGGEYAIRLEANNTSLSNFTVLNSEYGVLFSPESWSHIVKEVTFYNITRPLVLQQTYYNLILNNSMTKTRDTSDPFIGIYLEKTNTCIISNNRIKGYRFNVTDTGIEIRDSSGDIIQQNFLYNCSLDALESEIAKNTFTDNFYNDGPIVCLKNIALKTIYGAAQIILYQCEDIIIQYGSFTGQRYAVFIYDSCNCIVQHCFFRDNSQAIRITGSRQITIADNYIDNDVYSHLPPDYRMGMVIATTIDSMVTNNTIINTNLGLYLKNSQHNKITHNLFKENQGVKIIQDTYDAGGIMVAEGIWNLILSNTFIRNFPNVLYYDSILNLFLHNYWGWPCLLPKPILGITAPVPWYPSRLIITFDLRPALMPLKTT